MDAIPLDPIALVAVDPARNIRRRWQVRACRDLFGQWVVETCWGRIGAAGRCRTQAFACEGDARRHIAALLARRRGAVRRIGVAYFKL